MSKRVSNHFVYRLIMPRPTFDQDMSADEAAIMARHAEYWSKVMDAGKALVYGPVRDSTSAWGLGIVKAESPDEVRAIAAEDPAVSSGMATFDVGVMAVTVVPD
jgi:uncharacterized protein YciI